MAAWSFCLFLVPLCKMDMMAGTPVAILEHEAISRMEAMLCVRMEEPKEELEILLILWNCHIPSLGWLPLALLCEKKMNCYVFKPLLF